MANEEQLRSYLRFVTTDLHETRERLERLEAEQHEPIAIVGMSCRFPGGVTLARGPVGPRRRRRRRDIGLPERPGLGPRRAVRPRPGRPGTSYAREGGFVYDAARVRRGLLRDQPARGAGDGPAAAAAAGDRRGRRWSAPGSTRPPLRGSRYRRVRRRHRRRTTAPLADRAAEAVEGYLVHRATRPAWCRAGWRTCSGSKARR